jgi:hypothetical protein
MTAILRQTYDRRKFFVSLITLNWNGQILIIYKNYILHTVTFYLEGELESYYLIEAV